MAKQKEKQKLDLSITPLRLGVVIVGLGLVGANEFFGWNIPMMGGLFTAALIGVVYGTQPKK